MKKTTLIYSLLIGVFIFINFYLYFQLIKIGNEIYLLEEKNNQIKAENQLLEKRILEMDNLTTLASQAAELGLKYETKTWIIEPKNFAYSY